MRPTGIFKAMLALLVVASNCAYHAHAAEPITIGQSMPIGTIDFSIVQRVQAGVKAYVEIVNAKGGINGRLIRVISMDDAGDPRHHADNLRQMARESNPVAFLNCMGDASCAVGSEVAAQLHIPMIGPISGSKNLDRNKNPYVFKVRPGYDREAEALVNQMHAIGVTNIALITDSSKLSESSLALQDSAKRLKVQMTTLTFNLGGVGAPEKLLADLAAGHFQGVILDVTEESIETIVARKLDVRDEWPMVIMSMSNSSVIGMAANFPKHMVGFTVVVPNPENAAIPVAWELKNQGERYTTGDALTYEGMQGYINAKLCIEAIRRIEANKVDAQHLFATLNKTPDFDVGGFTVSFVPGHNSGSDWVDVAVRSQNGIFLK